MVFCRGCCAHILQDVTKNDALSWYRNFQGKFLFVFFFFYNSRNILVMKVKTRLRKSCVRDRSLFMWGGGGDFFCFSMKEKT